MKKIIFFAVLLLLAAPLFAQSGVRYDSQVTQVQVPSNAIFAIPGAQINFCSAPANAVPCTNKTTTYTDDTLTTPCPSSSQLVLAGTNSCVANTDQYGNWGVWVAAGQYTYTITTAFGSSGPFYVTAGGSSNSGGLFSSYQISTYTPITSQGNYIQFLPGTNVTLGQTGAGTALSPYLVTITASTTAATAWSAITPGTNTNASGGNGFILTQGDTGTTPWTINCSASETVPCENTVVGTTSALQVGPLGYVNVGIGLNVFGPASFQETTGTPPFTVTSTTNVPNLNASSLNGFTFAAPGAIGGTTPGAATFTAVTDTALVSGSASNVCATTAGVLYVSGCSGTQAWSSLTGATAATTIANAGFTTTFQQTVLSNTSGGMGIAWTWANTSSATSSFPETYPPSFVFSGAWYNTNSSASSPYQWQLGATNYGGYGDLEQIFSFTYTGANTYQEVVQVPNLVIASIGSGSFGNCLQASPPTFDTGGLIAATAYPCAAQNVNGSTLSGPLNFNGTTPAAGSGYVNGTFQISGNNVSVEVPTGSTPSVGGTCAVQFASGTSFQGDATNFCYTTSTHALAITGQLTAASLVLTSQNSFTLGNGSQTNASFYQADSGSGTSNTTPAYLALGASPADTYFSYLYPCSSAGNWCASSSTPSADSSRTIAFHGGYNPQSGTTYTIANTDEDGLTSGTGTASATWTLPCPSGTTFPQGWADTLIQGNTGSVTVSTSGCNILVNGTAGTSLTVPTTGVKITSTGSATGTAFVASFNGSGSGSGVTSFTGDGIVLSNSASTGAVTATLATAGAYKFLMNNTASPATPTYATATLASAQFANQGTTSQVLIGNASGNPSWGTLPCGAMPTFTGDVSNSSCAMTVLDVHGVTYPASPSTTTVPVVTASNTVTYENLPINYLGNPNASHAFTMGNDTLDFNFGAAVGSSTAFYLSDSSSDTGTGGLLGVGTAATSSNIAAIFEATAASNGTFTNPYVLLLGNMTAATSSQNQPSPEFGICGNAWEESSPASFQDCGVFQYTFASGSNPTATLALTRSSPGTNTALTFELPASSTNGASFVITPGTAASSPPNGAIWTTSTGVYAEIAGSTVGPFGSGGSGAPGGVTILKKTATYAGSSSDFSSSSAAPTQVIFTLSGTGQTYTLQSSAPSSGSCVIVEDSLASSPYLLGIITGGSTTLDGTAYTAGASSIALGPGQSAEYCSDGSNYFTQAGRAVPVISASGVGGFCMVDETCTGTTITEVPATSANTVVVSLTVLHATYKVSNFTVDIGTIAVGTADWGIYDSSGNLLVSTGGQSTDTAGVQTFAAATATTLPPGAYYMAVCSSSTTATIGLEAQTNARNLLLSASSGSIAHTSGTAANACSTGVLPSTLGTVTNGTAAPNGWPLAYVTP